MLQFNDFLMSVDPTSLMMLPPDSSKLDGVSDDMETEPGSPIVKG